MKVYDSPAKVNLNLRVLRRLEDGFHEIETLMAPLTLKDQLSFEKAEIFSLECDYPGVPLDQSNLVWKAAQLLGRETGKTFDYKVKIDKSIPHGAGLAGGSSNAATSLIALNELEGLGFSKERLAALGSQIGADIAFFIHQQCSICRGRGELVEPVRIDAEQEILLVKPAFGVMTPAAYKAWEASSELSGITYAAQTMPWGVMQNDLERPVFEKHRFLAELKMWLLSRPEVQGAMMSGSGSTVFALIQGDVTQMVEEMRESLDASLWVKRTRIVF